MFVFILPSTTATFYDPPHWSAGRPVQVLRPLRVNAKIINKINKNINGHLVKIKINIEVKMITERYEIDMTRQGRTL